MHHKEALSTLWITLYGETYTDLLHDFLLELERHKDQNILPALPNEWYKDVVVYSLYVDLFNEDFPGLEAKLPYLKDLGVSCLWLLPILDSPMRDAGFDISDYRRIRPGLLGQGKDSNAFDHFLNSSRAMGIYVIFDIAMNHTSDEHPWFQEARKGIDNPFREFYIWSDTPDRFAQARIIFQGLEESNWKKEGEEWFFHRFFDFQPDLNYRNPHVIIEMCRIFLFWLQKGIDGFRADAIPYLWKEEGTHCENLTHTHTVVKFFRQVIEMARPNTLLLAEACQKPKEVVKYFGTGDECQAGYHFPLMPQIYKALALREAKPIKDILGENITPPIPDEAQWFTFLRCHDELSLELVYVTEADRKFIHEAYCKKGSWDFREGQGISARLAELLDHDPKKIALVYSIMMSLPGTPVIYYGDEFGKLNDEDYYSQQTRISGKNDTRFLVRGRLDWPNVIEALNQPNSLSFQVFQRLRSLINQRIKHPSFGRGSIQWHAPVDEDANPLAQVLAFTRAYLDDTILCVHNLSDQHCTWSYTKLLPDLPSMDLLGQALPKSNKSGVIILPGFSYYWISLTSKEIG